MPTFGILILQIKNEIKKQKQLKYLILDNKETKFNAN